MIRFLIACGLLAVSGLAAAAQTTASVYLDPTGTCHVFTVRDGASGPLVPLGCVNQADETFVAGMYVAVPQPAGASSNPYIARLLSARAGDMPTVLDAGVKNDGTDQTTKLNSLFSALTSAGSGLIRFPQGSYTYGSITNASVGYEMDAVALALAPGGGFLPGILDPYTASKSMKVMGGPLGSRFDHVLNIAYNNQPSGSMSSYERSGLILRYEQGDPSGPVNRDLVGIDAQGQIRQYITNGRIWGYTATMNAFGDGYVLAGEFGINNQGSFNAWPANVNSKIGLQLVSGGTADNTAAISFVNNGSAGKWNHGVYADTSALVSNLFWLDSSDGSHSPLFYVSNVGDVLVRTQRVVTGKRIQGSGVGIGIAQAGELVLRNISTGGSAVRLTADGLAANVNNVLNLGDYTSYSVQVLLTARNASTGNTTYSWMLPVGALHRASGAGSVLWSTSATPVTSIIGVTSPTPTISISADTTNGGLSVVFAPPSGNTQTWNVDATIRTTEVQ